MPISEVSISPMDHGFLYGVGFFETFRTYEGYIIDKELHEERMNRALKDVRISLDYSFDEVERWCRRLNEEEGGRDGYFRWNVYAGEEGIGMAADRYDHPHHLLLRKPLQRTERGTSKRGFILEHRRNTPESSMRHKSFNFLNNVKARQEVTSLATEEGILLNADGFVTEGVTSNIFWVKDCVVYTPSRETGLLEGTLRHRLLQLARQHYEVEVGCYEPSDLLNADEVWVTNAVQELVPLHEIDHVSFLGKEGPVYSDLHKQYIEYVKERVSEQC